MKKSIIAVMVLGTLAGCASLPNGPSVAVMPASGKPFEVFAAEDVQCRQFAQQSIGTSASQNATDSEIKSIAAGTAIGAAAGVLGGGHQGAGSGAAFGMLGGAAMGSEAAAYSGREAQRRYDISYEQCMYAKGNQLPQASYYQPRVLYALPPAPPSPIYYPVPAGSGQ
jgi:hypothetical protein